MQNAWSIETSTIPIKTKHANFKESTFHSEKNCDMLHLQSEVDCFPWSQTAKKEASKQNKVIKMYGTTNSWISLAVKIQTSQSKGKSHPQKAAKNNHSISIYRHGCYTKSDKMQKLHQII